MTDDTNIREQTRAVFLAAIMILSMVAMSATFAGSAVAFSQDDVDQSLELDTTTAGEDTGVTITLQTSQELEDIEGLQLDITDNDADAPDLTDIEDGDVDITIGGDSVEDTGFESADGVEVDAAAVSANNADVGFDLVDSSDESTQVTIPTDTEVIIEVDDGAFTNDAEVQASSAQVTAYDAGWSSTVGQTATLTYETTQAQIDVDDESTIRDVPATFTVTVSDSAGEGIENVDVDAEVVDEDDEDVIDIDPQTNNTDGAGETEFEVTSEEVGEYDIEFTEQQTENNATATLTVEDVATSVTDFEIDGDTPTVLDTPIDNEYIQDETEFEEERNTTNFVYDPNLAGDSGLLGVPFHLDPYAGLDGADDIGAVQQSYTITADVGDTEGDTEQIVIDHSDSLAEGAVLVDAFDEEIQALLGLDREDIAAVTNVDGADEENFEIVDINPDIGTITIESSAEADANDVEIDVSAHLTSVGLVTDTTTSVDVTVEGPAGDSESDNYRLVNVGIIGFEQADLPVLTEDSESDGLDTIIDERSFSGGEVDANSGIDTGSEGPVSYNVWAGSVLTLQQTDERTSVEFYEVDENAEGETVVGDQVFQRGTSPGDTTSIDTARDEFDESGEYFIGFGEDESKLAYVNLRALNLDAEISEQVTVNNDVEIDVTSNDIGATDFEGSLQAWFFEDGDDPLPSNAIHVEQGSFDGDGEDTLSVDPEADLNGVDDYYAVVVQDESLNFALTGTVEVIAPLDEDVEIVSPDPADEEFARGDIIPVELDMENTERATITFGDMDTDQNFELNVTVQDVDGSGTAEFLINTFQLGDEEADNGVRAIDAGTEIVSVTPHSEIAIAGGSADESPVVISAGNYDLRASTGDTPASVSRTYDRSIARLNERTTGELEAWSAPSSGDPVGIEDFETVDEIADAIEAGDITPQEGTLADNDFLILNIETTGLEGVLANIVEEELDGDLEEFLDRSETHAVTEAILADDDLIELTTIQDLDQVEQLLTEALQDDQRNVPRDTSYALPAFIDLEGDEENQEVLAGVDDTGNLDEYFYMTPVDNETVADVIEPDGDEIANSLDNFDDATLIELVDRHPNWDVDDFSDDGEFDRDAFEDAIEFEDEVATNVVPTHFNTTFALGSGISEDEAADDFPLNEFFGGETEELLNWTLVDDVVDFDDIRTVERNDEEVDLLLIPPQDNYVLEGTTEIAAGTTLAHVTDSASGEDPPFFNTGEFTVEYVEGEENVFSYEIEDPLSEHAGQAFSTEVLSDATGLAVTADGVPVQGEIREVANVTQHEFNEQTRGGETVMVDLVEVNQEGEVQIENEDGDVLGSADLEEGENEDIRVVLDEPIDESQDLTSVIVDADGEEFDEDESDAPVRVTAAYTLVGEADAFFQVSNLDPIAATVEPGEALTVSADVTNVGGAEDTQEVELLLDGDAVASEEVTLDADDSESVSFEIDAPDEEGVYTHSVATANDEDQGQLTVEADDPDEPANFAVDIDLSDTNVEPGDDVTITGTVENTGDEEATQTVSITFDGDEEASQELTLAGGESDTITADVTAPDEEGNYDATVESDDDTASATLTVAEDEPPEDDDDDDGAGFGVAAALIAFLGAALLAYRRRAN